MKKILLVFLIFQMFSFAAIAQQYKYHIVKSGESLPEIARKYNVSEEVIFQLNPDARNGIREGSKIVVPVKGSSVTKENRNVPAANERDIKFVTHRVKKKENLFRLSQRYNVEIEDIKRFNKHLYSEELRRGERIRIPVNLPKVSAVPEEEKPSTANPLDLSAKEHVVLPKEGWFRISQKYNITIEDLKRLNPGVTVLQPGMVIKVGNGQTDQLIDVDGKLFTYYRVQPQETLYTLTRRFGISKDSLTTLNPALAGGLESGMVLKIPNPAIFSSGEGFSEENIVNLERRLTNFNTKNLVLMLPFNLHKITTTDTTSNAPEVLKKDPVMQLTLDFYSGVLMAVDSAKAQGISTNLQVIDTEQNSEKVRSIVMTNNFDNVDAVIGPLLQEQVEIVGRSLEGKNIPVVSPLTKKPTNALNNFLQTLPTDEMLSQAMISYISENSDGKNLIIIADGGAAAKKRDLLAAFPSAKIVNPREGSFVNRGELVAALEKGRPNWVILEGSQIGVLSNATSTLNALRDAYNITLLTTDKNNSFESDNISNAHLAKLNFHFPSVGRAFGSDNHAGFVQKYEEKYGMTPSKYAVRGFDVTYDILLRLASADNLFASLEGKGTTKYVENKFDYENKPTGGFQNRAVYILAYDRNLGLKEVR